MGHSLKIFNCIFAVITVITITIFYKRKRKNTDINTTAITTSTTAAAAATTTNTTITNYELQLNKANISNTEALFLDLHLSISNGFVLSKIYDKHDDFDFDIVNFPIWDGDVPRSTSYGVYISQLIRFARVSSHVADFNARNKSLTAKLLQQGYRYHKLRKTFSKFYCRHYELVSIFSVGLKILLHQGLSEPEFYGGLVYKFKKNCR